MIGQSSNSLRTSKGLKIHFNSRHKGLYIVLAFAALLLVTGGTIALTTGKIVNPFNKAGLGRCDDKCLKSCDLQYENKQQECNALITIDQTQSCKDEAKKAYQTCKSNCCNRPGGEITPVPTKPIQITPKAINGVTNGCQHDDDCYDACSNGERGWCGPDGRCKCPTTTPTPQCTKARCDSVCAKKGQIFIGICRDDGTCMCRNPKTTTTPTSTPTPTPTRDQCQDDSDCVTAPGGGKMCATGTPKCDKSSHPYTCYCDYGTSSSSDNNGNSSGNSSSGSSSNSGSSCNQSYKIPIEISSISVTQNACNSSTGKYTIGYKIVVHAQGISGECGGTHYNLKVIYPSGVNASADVTSANPGLSSKSGNVAAWNNQYTPDATDHTFNITAVIPKSEITNQNFTATIKVEPADSHASTTSNSTKSQTTNAGACYTHGSTNDTPTPTPTTTGEDNNTTGEDNTNPYIPPNTGILDEHPILIVTGIAVLGILESAFGIFSNALIKLKEFAD